MRVDIVDVCARDGLQNDAVLVSTEQKLELIRRLIAAGIRSLEVTSFVNPARVPQMADAEALCAALPDVPGVRYAGLVLNERGYERAAATGRLHEVCVVVPLSDTFGLRNQGQRTAEAVEAARRIAQRAAADGLGCQITLAVAFGCPFEGEVPASRIGEVAAAFAKVPVSQFILSDTIGVAVPPQVIDGFAALRSAIGTVMPVRGHFHNTRNTAPANLWAALGVGVRAFDASLGGVGGCPFAPAATGNIATEDVHYLLQRSGYDSGVDLQQLIAASTWLGGVLGRALPGMLARAGGFQKHVAPTA